MNRPWLTSPHTLWGALLVCCSVCGLSQEAGAHAGTPSGLSVDSRLQAAAALAGGKAALAFIWHNHGPRPVLIQTHVDSDGGVMYDAIVFEQGAMRAPLVSIRKASAQRYCVLPAGQRHTEHILDVGHWLSLLGMDAALPWRASYVMDASAPAPADPMPVCGAPDRMGSATLWRGRSDGPLMAGHR